MTNEPKSLESWQKEDAMRLNALFKERAQTSQAEFGARYKIGSQGMVWQYLSGRRPLNIKAARAFATGLGVSIEQFSPTLASEIVEASLQASNTKYAWPFARVDEQKVRSLKPAELSKVEDALLESAGLLGLDIKKT